MGGEGTNSFWATEIRNEISDPDIAANLIRGIDNILPWLKERGVDRDTCGQAMGKANSAANKQIRRLDRQIRNLASTLNSLDDRARTTIRCVEMNRLSEALLAGSINTDRPPQFDSTFDSFMQTSSDMQIIVSTALANVSARPGRPSNQLRDLLVNFLGSEFNQHAPNLCLSHRTSSLFYRVVTQYLEDNSVDEGNLQRTIQRLFPNAHFSV